MSGGLLGRGFKLVEFYSISLLLLGAWAEMSWLWFPFSLLCLFSLFSCCLSLVALVVFFFSLFKGKLY